MIVALDAETLKVALLWMTGGINIYYLYSQFNSKLHNNDYYNRENFIKHTFPIVLMTLVVLIATISAPDKLMIGVCVCQVFLTAYILMNQMIRHSKQ